MWIKGLCPLASKSRWKLCVFLPQRSRLWVDPPTSNKAENLFTSMPSISGLYFISDIIQADNQELPSQNAKYYTILLICDKQNSQTYTIMLLMSRRKRKSEMEFSGVHRWQSLDTGDMAQPLGILTTLSEDQCLILRTYMTAYNWLQLQLHMIWHLSGPLMATDTRVVAQIYTQIKHPNTQKYN